jgi:hypothetical protein
MKDQSLLVKATMKSTDKLVMKPTKELTKKPTKKPTETEPTKILSAKSKEETATKEPTQETQAYCVSSLTGGLHVPQIILRGTYNNHLAKILIDCGATGDFISCKFVKAKKIPTSERTLLAITLADGWTQETCATQTTSLTLCIGPYSSQLNLDLTTLNDDYDIILGMPWLQQTNPIINWADWQLTI